MGGSVASTSLVLHQSCVSLTHTGYFVVVQRLLLEGANPNLPGNANFVGTAGAKEDTNLLWVPPVYAAVTARCGNVEILRLLLCSFARISCHLDKVHFVFVRDNTSCL